MLRDVLGDPLREVTRSPDELGRGGLGPELITNGGFDADLAGWTITLGGTGTVTWSAGSASVLADGATATYISQPVATVAGRRYTITFDVATNPISAGVGTTLNGQNIVSGAVQNPGSRRIQFNAIGATTYVTFWKQGATVTLLDNASVRAVL